MEQNPEELDDAIEGSGRRRKILIWLIVACVVAAIIGIPALLLRQTEPTAATEPTTIEQLQSDLDSVELTVAGHTEDIADLETASCVCPDYATDITNLRNSHTALQAEVDAIVIPSISPDLSTNVSEITVGLADLGDDLTALEADLVALQAEVDGIVVTDWASAISALTADVTSLEASMTSTEANIALLEGQIASLDAGIDALQDAIDLLPTTLPRYAVVESIGSKYLEVSVTGAGDYPVVVTLYGTALALSEVREVDLADYDIIYEMVYAANRMLTLFVEPSVAWGASDTIILVIDEITGSISYAAAAVGGEA